MKNNYDLKRNKNSRPSDNLEFAMSVADDLLDIDFGEAADVDIGSLDNDFNLMSGYQEVTEHSDQETQRNTRPVKLEADNVRIFCSRQ